MPPADGDERITWQKEMPPVRKWLEQDGVKGEETVGAAALSFYSP